MESGSDLLPTLSRWGCARMEFLKIFRTAAAGRARAATVPYLEAIEVVGAHDEREGNGSDDDLAEGADDERTRALFEEVAQVGA